jgi:hypothetical protein
VALLWVGRVERGVLVRVLQQAAAYRQQLDERLARMIVGELAQAWNRGRK